MSAETYAPSLMAGAFVMPGPSARRIEVTVMATEVRPEVIHLTDDSTRADIAEAITHLAQYAARQMHHPDCTRWVRAHQRIDTLLGEWEAAPA